MKMKRSDYEAIRYNKDGGRVTVTVGKDGVAVRDTGIGIPREYQARIFERFYRVDKSIPGKPAVRVWVCPSPSTPPNDWAFGLN